MVRAALILSIVLSPMFVPSGLAQSPESNESMQEEPNREVRRLRDLAGATEEEWSMDIGPLPSQAPEALEIAVPRLPDPDRNARLSDLLDRARAQGRLDSVRPELDALMIEVRNAGIEALQRRDLGTARQRQAVLQVLAPERSIATRIAAELAAMDAERASALDLDSALLSGRLVAEDGDDALSRLDALSALNPPEELLETRIEAVDALARQTFDEALEAGRLDAASLLIRRAGSATSLDLPVEQWEEQLQERTRVQREQLIEQARSALRAGDAESAALALSELESAAIPTTVMNFMRLELEQVEQYGALRPGQVFSDFVSEGIAGPEMVVVPAGEFRLGAPTTEVGSSDIERPEYSARFDRGFAMARTEITVGQYRTFIESTGYRTESERGTSSLIFDLRAGSLTARDAVDWRSDFSGLRAADDEPVVHVSWNDAVAYAEWLSESTGEVYRLPSESEFEYAARANQSGPYWWSGRAIAAAAENLSGDQERSRRGHRWTDSFPEHDDGYWGPAPVGTFEPNPFGLFDMSGNVMEWTSDCWRDDHSNRPIDGSAIGIAPCDRHAVRGGSWASGPTQSRSAHRVGGESDRLDPRIGFRVVREL